MKKLLLLITLCLLWAGSAVAATDCDVWLGNWDMTKTDSSTYSWVINAAVTGADNIIICQAQGTSTPKAGGAPVAFQIIKVNFYPEFIYTESTKLGEGMGKQVLLLNDAKDGFASGTAFTDYNIQSGVKQVSGPRCGGLDPTYVTGGDTQVEVTINGKETSFDNTTTVVFGSTDITVDSIKVDNATKITAIITVADNAADQECTVTTTTGSEQIVCTLKIRGAGDTSRLVWSFATDGLVSSSPAINGDYVYVGSVDNNVYCLNRKTGKQKWRFATGNSIFSSPVVSSGKVYVGSSDDKLYCLTADNGTWVWDFTTGGNVQSSPAIADGRVYVGSFDHNVYCVDEKTGVKEWDFHTDNDVYSTPAIVDNRVYVGGVDFKMHCLNAKTGEEIWNFPTDGDIPPSPAVVDGYVYFGNKAGKFYCVDADTGIEKWDFPVGDVVYDSAAVANGYVFFGSVNKNVYCLDAATGVQKWMFTASGGVYSSPAVTSDYVYIGSNDGNLYCLDAKWGTEIWHYKTGAAVYSSPAVAHGLIYFGSYDNFVYCINGPDNENAAWPMYRANIKRTGTRTGSCIAQKLLGKRDKSLATLRLFRDRVLAKTSTGKKLIDLYYAYGDQLGTWCQRYPLVESMAKHLIRAMVPVADLVAAG